MLNASRPPLGVRVQRNVCSDFEKPYRCAALQKRVLEIYADQHERTCRPPSRGSFPNELRRLVKTYISNALTEKDIRIKRTVDGQMVIKLTNERYRYAKFYISLFYTSYYLDVDFLHMPKQGLKKLRDIFQIQDTDTNESILARLFYKKKQKEVVDDIIIINKIISYGGFFEKYRFFSPLFLEALYFEHKQKGYSLNYAKETMALASKAYRQDSEQNH